MISKKSALLLSGVLLAGVAIQPAWAQEAPSQDTANSGLSDIIVIARKRVESAQSVPVAVTAISAQTIERRDMTSIEKIAAATPNLTVGHAGNGSGAQITLRGVGSSSTSIGIEQSVATIVDGVYYGQGRVLEEGFFDLAGVEILKGPQALFFGKNATAGVISIKTADPTPTWQFKTTASYEFKGKEAQLEGVASGPVTDTLGVRLAVRGTKAWGGYYDNVSTPQPQLLIPFTNNPTSSNQPGNKELLGRLTLKYEPNAQFTDTLKASYDYSHVANSSYNYVAYNCPGGTTVAGYTCGYNFVTHQNDMSPQEAAAFPYAADGRLYNKYRSAAITNTMNYEFGNITLTDVANYNWNNNRWLCNCDYQPTVTAVLATENSSWHAFSNELRALTHYDSPINAMIGLLYQKTKRNYVKYVSYSLNNDPTAGPDRYVDAEKDSFTRGETISGFGQVMWKVVPTVEFDAGVRYTHETKDSDFVQPYVSAAFAGVWVQGRHTPAHQVWNNWSPELTLTWKPIHDVMVYGAFKTGYKSGGFSNGSIDSAFGDPAKDLVFKPETVNGFEAGVKSTLLDNQLRLNLDVYSYKYKNLQIDFFNSTIIAFQTLTADARTKGVELEFEFAPRAVAGLNLHGALNYNDAKYTSFPAAPCYAGQSPAEGCNLYADGTAINPLTDPTAVGVRQNLTGAPLGMAPHWTGAIGFNYEVPVGGSFKLGFNTDMRYSSSYYVSGFGESFSKQKGYAVLDMGVRLSPEDDNWKLAVIAKNVTNKQYINGGVDGPNTGGGTGSPAGPYTHADLYGFGAMPRTVQIQITKNF